jgi:hypothetical protein
MTAKFAWKTIPDYVDVADTSTGRYTVRPEREDMTGWAARFWLYAGSRSISQTSATSPQWSAPKPFASGTTRTPRTTGKLPPPAVS